jgi:hypothetical protein
MTEFLSIIYMSSVCNEQLVDCAKTDHGTYVKSKADPLHAMEAHGGEEVRPTRS